LLGWLRLVGQPAIGFLRVARGLACGVLWTLRRSTGLADLRHALHGQRAERVRWHRWTRDFERVEHDGITHRHTSDCLPMCCRSICKPVCRSCISLRVVRRRHRAKLVRHRLVVFVVSDGIVDARGLDPNALHELLVLPLDEEFFAHQRIGERGD